MQALSNCLSIGAAGSGEQLLAKLRLIRLVKEGRGVRTEAIVKALKVDLATGTYETTPLAEAAARVSGSDVNGPLRLRQ